MINGESLTFNQQRFEAAYRIVQACNSVEFSDFSPESLHVFDSIPSTNQTVWELLTKGAYPGVAVLALEQTAGKGQWGRQWSSPRGGLYLSVLLAPDLPVENSAQLTLCSAWGIAKVLRDIPNQLSGVTDRIPVQVKWLNDLVLEGRKLGGILTETRISQDRITSAVVGVGINWVNPVPETGINLKSYLERQEVPLIESLEMLAALILHGLLFGYEQWQKKGIDALLPSYVELMAYRDRSITIDGKPGTIIGVSPKGELRVCLQTEGSEVASASQITSSNDLEVLLKPGTISLGYKT